jgi:NAD(P)-dependent dehydrogenase (short-subunit alcohol dehydrogenase family)
MQTDVLVGKRALLTHSGDGLGFVIAIAFAQAGADVIIQDRSAAVVAAAVERLSLAVPGSRVSGKGMELAGSEHVGELLAFAGPVDFLVIDALATGAVDFAEATEQAPLQDRLARSEQATRLLNAFVQSMKDQGPASLFLLSLASMPAGEFSASLLRRGTDQIDHPASLEVFFVPIADLVLAPVADLVKSEVSRTNGSLAQASEHLLNDHRPAAIEAGLSVIQALTAELIETCTGHRS